MDGCGCGCGCGLVGASCVCVCARLRPTTDMRNDDLVFSDDCCLSTICCYVCLFLKGRISNPGVGDGQFLTLDSDLVVPREYENMFVCLLETEFRVRFLKNNKRCTFKDQPTSQPT